MNKVHVMSLMLGDGIFEIGFLETRNQAKEAGMTQSIQLMERNYPIQIEEIRQSLLELIDLGLTEIRNPPAMFVENPRERLAQAVQEGPREEMEGQLQMPDELLPKAKDEIPDGETKEAYRSDPDYK